MANIPSASEILTAVTAEDDFAHEVRVGAAIRSIPAVKVRHGGTYTDPVTKKPRQYDYRCWLRKEEAELALAIECKNLSPEFPAVVTGLPRTEDEAFVDVVRSLTGLHDRGIARIAGTSSATRRAKGSECFYPPGEFVGKSLVRVRIEKNVPVTKNDCDIYDKWSQALSSAIALVHNSCDLSRRESVGRINSAVIPAVVVPDGTLWRIQYSFNSSIAASPEKVDECELFVAKSIVVGLPQLEHRFAFSHLHFFTLKGFKSFLSRMAINDHAWQRLTNSGPEIILL